MCDKELRRRQPHDHTSSSVRKHTQEVFFLRSLLWSANKCSSKKIMNFYLIPTRHRSNKSCKLAFHLYIISSSHLHHCLFCECVVIFYYLLLFCDVCCCCCFFSASSISLYLISSSMCCCKFTLFSGAWKVCNR